MKTINLLLLTAAAGVLPAFPLCAQQYEVSWFTIDGGTSTSMGGAHSVSGTIGQPDAGAAAGGAYSLAGGFWGAFTGPDTSGPRLSIVRSGANCIIAWSPTTPGFVLQSTTSLGPAAWTDEFSGSSNPVTVPVTGAARFYRLKKP